MPPRNKSNGWSRKTKKKSAAPGPDVVKPVGKSLAGFPPELRRMIGEHFDGDPVSSICLGLTCKAFMEVHKEFHHDPVPLKSNTFMADGRERTLIHSLVNWFPRDVAYNWETGRYAKLSVLQEQGGRYKRAMEVDEKGLVQAAERDMERIAERKRGRRRYGSPLEDDDWSLFSAISDMFFNNSFYEPSNSNSSGTTEHSRRWHLKERERRQIAPSKASSTLRDNVGNAITIMDDDTPEDSFAEETDNHSEADSRDI